MALYRYIKSPAKSVRFELRQPKIYGQTSARGVWPGSPGGGEPEESRGKWLGWILSSSFLAAGFLMVGMVVWPIAEYELTYLAKAPKKRLVKPIPEALAASGRVRVETEERKDLDEAVALGVNSPVAPLLGASLEETLGLEVENQEEKAAEAGGIDLTRASNWFVGASQKKVSSRGITHYTLDISKLRIEKATVEIGGDDLMKSLIHWGGTANPGELGNTVIFGHSCLPQFYNPADYKCIFSKLMDLNIGDDFYLNFDGISYKYRVFELLTVEPEDVSVLEQRFDDAYVTLITCTPPGTYWYRGVVRARLTRI